MLQTWRSSFVRSVVRSRTRTDISRRCAGAHATRAAPAAAPSKPTVVNAVFSWRFALLWVMIACSAAATGLTASTLKLYADKHETAKVVEMFPPSLTAKVVEMFPMAAALSIPMAAALGNALGRLLCGAARGGVVVVVVFSQLVPTPVGFSVRDFATEMCGPSRKRRFSTAEKLRVLVALGTKYPKTIVPGVLGTGTCGLEEQ